MLGVIGGMGPLATADFFHKLIAATPAACDEDHIPTLIHSVPQLPSRPAAILRGGESPLPALLSARDRLVRLGATMLAMPCNTAHHWHAALAEGGIPFPHIADAVASEVSADAARIGIVATTATLATRIYEQRFSADVEWLIPDATTFERAVQPGIDAVKRNAAEEGGRLLEPVVAQLLERGAERVVLACTELPVALDAIGSPLRSGCIDSTAALARMCVRLWPNHLTATRLPNL